VDELTRFARRLVEQLGASGEGVHRAVPVSALRETLLPYRKHRRALGVESVEDYETVLLRLVAGERGFLKTVPAEAAERCRSELAQATPDLAVLDEVAGATVQITSMAAAQVVGDGGDGGDGRTVRSDRTDGLTLRSALTPPSASAASAASAAPAAPSPPSPEPAMPAPKPPAAEKCRHCDHAIPGGRQVVFCPWCGQRLIPFTCARCNTELDSEWRHCITCGAPVKDPFRYA
jgi:double zinc ribbon protein